ncbi:peptidase [Myxosarcina sp. GI1(2024)]
MKWWQQTLVGIAVILLVHSQFSANPLPDLKPHPLPGSLASWEDRERAGDYFDRIESTQMGYLIWSEFPIKVYIDRSSYAQNTASHNRFEQWLATVREAIGEWNVYLPLVEIDNPRLADITIVRLLPKREIKLDPETGLYDIPRAVAAKTDYRFLLREETATVAHKMTVTISPSFLGESLLATVRHELGHALGIWGHSLELTDALYYSQVREPVPISSRDINTLRKIYQQPTRLGWKSEK